MIVAKELLDKFSEQVCDHQSFALPGTEIFMYGTFSGSFAFDRNSIGEGRRRNTSWSIKTITAKPA